MGEDVLHLPEDLPGRETHTLYGAPGTQYLRDAAPSFDPNSAANRSVSQFEDEPMRVACRGLREKNTTHDTLQNGGLDLPQFISGHFPGVIAVLPHHGSVMCRFSQSLLRTADLIIATTLVVAGKILGCHQAVEQVERGMPERCQRLHTRRQVVVGAERSERPQPPEQAGIPSNRDVKRALGVEKIQERASDSARLVEGWMPGRD